VGKFFLYLWSTIEFILIVGLAGAVVFGIVKLYSFLAQFLPF
jgi:hypothetical protein